MATIPYSATDIRLISGIPFQKDYKHVRWFDNVTQQTQYFLSKNVVHTVSDNAYQKIENRFVIKANKHIDSLWNVNYIMFRNKDYNNKWFYAFVDKLEFINNGLTLVHFTIDVLQTWMFDIHFKPSFVAREHRPLWNSDGTPVVNTVDEGLNYGTEYDNVFTYQYYPNGGYKWLVIVTKTPLESDDNKPMPNVIGTPQPLCYYIAPFRDDDTTPNIVLNGELEGVTKPTEILKAIYNDENAVNNVVSLYVTDYTGIPTMYQPNSEVGNTPVITFNDPDSELEFVVLTNEAETGANNYQLIRVTNVKRFKPLTQQILDNKYQMYHDVEESKLLMYPYTTTIVDDFRGNRILLKNEYLNTKELSLSLKGSLGTSNKTSANFPEYNQSPNDGQKLATSNESALINNNANDIPILNEYLSAYLQGNRNSLVNQVNSIVFNGITNTISSGISTVSAIASKNISGATQTGVGMVGGYFNTQLQLEGLMAKQEDISNVPPQISKMGNNTAYEYGNGYTGVFIIQKQIKAEYRKKLSDYFKMFGYKLNEVKIPNFHTRENWNYIQTESCVITGNINNQDLNEIKAIFNSGVTLWHTDDIGNYALSNGVL